MKSNKVGLMKIGIKTVSIFLFLLMILITIAEEALANNDNLLYLKYLISNYYVEEVDKDILNANTIKEILYKLGDPYSSYMNAKEYTSFIESIEREFVGIGVTVEKAEDGILIMSVFKDSGAEDAGLQPGDVIIQADGVELKDMDLSQATMYIKGDEGTRVLLTVKRGETVFIVSVLRKRIIMPIVEWEFIDGVGYIKIWSFGEDTVSQFEHAVNELKERDAKGLIVDLRGNGGGYLQSGIDMVGHFVGRKPAALVYTRNEGWYYILSQSSSQIDLPTLVLVDGYTASASELFAGALRDYGKAYLLGSNTFGKGSIQSLFELSDGSVLKLTTGYFYTPSGRQINGIGLKPDLRLQDEFLVDAAVLLLNGDAESWDSKNGYVAVQVEDCIYDVDLSKAQTDEYWESFRHIVEMALEQGKLLYVGTDEGWQKSDETRLHRWYYPYYEEVPVLEGIKPDKEFTVTFSKPVEAAEVEGKIQLIDAETGERIPCSVFQVSDTQVKVVPDELLQNGREYYLIIQEGIKARDGAFLHKGVLCRTIVED